ncbi:MAG: diaminopimelate epimerase [Zetaproteobacteria bacterium]|nr:diaminopimelate epimerase [Zetaproteobacteria bacterium]
MPLFPFVKMQAQGNDFIIIDGLNHPIPHLDTPTIRTLTDRRLGIGCDQLLVLTKTAAVDAFLTIYNQDGSQAMNCGNGLRCVGDYLLRQLNQPQCTLAIHDRTIQAERTDIGIRVAMGNAVITEENVHHIDLNIGNRHRVFFDAMESITEASSTHNIEIITGQVGNHAWIEIIERGVGPTLACGSGACAVTAAIWHRDQHNEPQTIEMPGGQVVVSGTPKMMLLEGAVSRVFTGEFEIKQHHFPF